MARLYVWIAEIRLQDFVLVRRSIAYFARGPQGGQAASRYVPFGMQVFEKFTPAKLIKLEIGTICSDVWENLGVVKFCAGG